MLPFYPMARDGTGHGYETRSFFRRLVHEYTGLTFQEVADLDYIQYLVWRRDAFIWKLNQTEEGQEYLRNAWRMEQTTPDREKLREKYKKKGGGENVKN